LDIYLPKEILDLIEQAAAEMGAFYQRGAGGPADTKSPLQPAELSAKTFNEAVARSQVLRRELERIPPKPRVTSAENGPRYSYRRELRNEERPMKVRTMPTPKRKIALGVLVDCSGSMGGSMEEVRKAVLATYLAADALHIPMAVWGFSDWHSPAAAPVVTYGMNNKLAPEYIAGLGAHGGTVLSPAFKEAREAMLKNKADKNVFLVIHDGQPSDMGPAICAIQSTKRQVEVIGIFLGDGLTNADLVAPMKELFADRLIVAEDADRLMTILGTFLIKIIRPSQV